MSGRYRKLLIFWGVLFVVSLYFVFSGIGSSFGSRIGSSDGLDKPTGVPDRPDQAEENGFTLGLVLAVITTAASGGGFVATTYFAMRDDRRQTALHQLQIASLKKEIEYKDLEISRLRHGQEPPSSSSSE